MSLENQIVNISQEIRANKEKILTMQTELVQMQENFSKAMLQANEILESTTNLAKKLNIPCNETIALGDSLKQLQDKIKENLQIKEVKWEEIEKDIEDSNSCLRNYLELYQTTVLELADQTSLELDPVDSASSVTPKTSLESSSSHFQQMLVAQDPLMDRDLFKYLNTRDLSVRDNFKSMEDHIKEFKEINSSIAAEVERISNSVHNVCRNNCVIKTEANSNEII